MATTKPRERGRMAILVLTLGVAPFVVALPARAQDEPRVAGVEVAAPRRTKFVPPEYPAGARAQGQRGIVILSLVVGRDGKVESAEVTRSVPPFDEAALAAARQWEFEITKVDGSPVRVRVSVPITFAMKLPDVIRGPGVPELREGLPPNRPAGVPNKAEARVVATLTVEATGRVTAIDIVEGEWPWFETVAAALRTWSFAAAGGGSLSTYQVEARFPAVQKDEARVELHITLKEQSARVPDDKPEAPAPSPVPDSPAPTPAPPPASALPPAPPPSAEPLPPPAAPTPTPEPGSAEPATSPPPVAAGASSVRGVVLGPGVPDLVAGRRPVVPPLARLGDLAGSVEVRFSVDASGSTAGLEAQGPDVLKEAARQTVASWSFHRTQTDRLFLVAVFEYRGTVATARVATTER